MSDFISSFWNWYVMALVAGSLLFCAIVLLGNTTKAKRGSSVELHGHVWDETLQEYNNPLPQWWMYLFWLTLAFGVGYLLLYPGFGRNQGELGWSARNQYETEMQRADERYGPIFGKFLSQDLKAVAADPEARAMGQRLFLTYCAQCHGSDARGAKGFPNLTDHDWLYGGEPETIKTTLVGGRLGVMPPWGDVLGGDGVKDVANYVRSLSSLAHDSLRAQRGKELFQQNCTACHGSDGTGNQALGAPNLTDKIWLYSSAESSIIETVTKGRQNQMPSFQALLGDAKVHLLAAYVYGLSNQTGSVDQ